MIHVIAILTAEPGRRDDLLTLFNANVPAVKAEEGCIEYSATVDIEGADPAFGPDVIVVVEKWENKAALKAHGASAHMAAYREAAKGVMSKAAVHVLDPV